MCVQCVCVYQELAVLEQLLPVCCFKVLGLQTRRLLCHVVLHVVSPKHNAGNHTVILPLQTDHTFLSEGKS